MCYVDHISDGFTISRIVGDDVTVASLSSVCTSSNGKYSFCVYWREINDKASTDMESSVLLQVGRCTSSLVLLIHISIYS